MGNLDAATVARLRELESAATEGPWAEDVRDDGRAWIDMPDIDGHALAAHGFGPDARLLTALRNNAADLLDAAEGFDTLLAGLLVVRERWRTRREQSSADLWDEVDAIVAAATDDGAIYVGPNLEAILAASTTRGDR